ncbi:hypothetical protein BDY17DRAFT_327800 [Neohortaea acidophila]|uniref:Uncharacterized protein n=1 Tax=Neohortaea acidophila TaxID=245834 RepID=A0A6A6PGA3_9PEZI|nr:uncharacterized protein BDY17DRAFT_327800 [Neohortaea acidophila]KAF2478992.1 hypothetical protein BDY17DRAFT_327800 [Neohortaea acidophila]
MATEDLGPESDSISQPDDSDYDVESLSGDTPATRDASGEAVELEAHARPSTAEVQASKAIEAAGGGPGRDSDNEIITSSLDIRPDRLVSDDGDHSVFDAEPAPPDYITATTLHHARGQDTAVAVDTGPVSNGRDVTNGPRSGVRTDPLNSSRTFLWRTLLLVIARVRLLLKDPVRAVIPITSISLLVLLLAMTLKTITPKSNDVSIPARHRDPTRHRNADPRCDFDTYREVNISLQDTGNFALIDDVAFWCRNGGCRARNGLFRVNVYDADQAELIPDRRPMSLRISVATAWPYVIDRVKYERVGNAITLDTPDISKRSGPEWDAADREKRKAGIGSGLGPCLDFVIDLFVPHNAVFTNWLTKLRHFSFHQAPYNMQPDGEVPSLPTKIQRRKGGITVTNTTLIEALYGNVSIHHWSSPHVHVESRTGNIEGTFSFHEELSFESWTGAIDVSIDYQDRSQGQNQDALPSLKTLTRSGNTTVAFPELTIPDRGVELPLPPSMVTRHLSTSGSLDLTYPHGWNGFVDGFSVKGKVRIDAPLIPVNWSQRRESTDSQVFVGSPKMEMGQLRFATETGDVKLAIMGSRPTEFLFLPESDQR